MSVTFDEQTITLAQIDKDMTKATEITITANVKEIEENVFKDFYDLETINYQGTYIDWCNIKFKNRFANPLFYTPHYKKRLVPKEGSLESLITTSYGDPVLSLENSEITTIPECTFYDLSRTEEYAEEFPFEQIIFGSGLKEIGDYAFYGLNKVKGANSGLTLVDLQNCTSLVTIGIAAFGSCKQLQCVRFPDINNSTVYIKDFAFYSSVAQSNQELLLTDCLEFGHYVFNPVQKLTIPARHLVNFDLTNVTELAITETDCTVLTPEVFKKLPALNSIIFILNNNPEFDMLALITDCLKECYYLKEIKVKNEFSQGKQIETTDTFLHPTNNHLIRKVTKKQTRYEVVNATRSEAYALLRCQHIIIEETDTQFGSTTTSDNTFNDILFITSVLPPVLITAEDQANTLEDLAAQPQLNLSELVGTTRVSLSALHQIYQKVVELNTSISATSCLRIILPSNTLFNY